MSTLNGKKLSLLERIERRRRIRSKRTGLTVDMQGIFTLEEAVKALALKEKEQQAKAAPKAAPERQQAEAQPKEEDTEEPTEREKIAIKNRKESRISKYNVHNQAYQVVRASLANKGVLDESNDPDNNDDDPLDYICPICLKNAETDSVSCYSQFAACKRWFHCACLGIPEEGPEFEWVCQHCANNHLHLMAPSGPEGVEITDAILELQPDSDDEADGDPDYELEEQTDDKEHGEEESSSNAGGSGDEQAVPSPPRKRKRKRKRKSKREHKSKSAPPRTKRSKISENEDIFDGNDDIEIMQEGEEEEKERIPARSAGANATTAKQQLDIEVRKKIRAVKKPKQILQSTSTPFTRTDEYDPDIHVDAEVAKEALFPWNVHGSFYFGNQAPNEEGSKDVGVLNKPICYFCAGSTANAKYLAQHFRDAQTKLKAHGEELGFKVKIMIGYDNYEQVFRSEKCKLKKAPPRPKHNKKSTIKIKES